ncbi:MAG: alpha-ribazole phosphatase [Chitinophagaceae bacterium]|nr:MAG: alpha-ribazole phosphatase [Chitinophagaceae bacterium]
MDWWLHRRLPRCHTTSKRSNYTFKLFSIMEIYLIRHTTPDVAKGICYGQTDLDIDKDLFEEELKIIQNKLPNDISKVYSSPLRRCTVLAQHLFSNFETDDRLMELNFGKWENKNWNDLDQTELNHWMADFVNVPASNGENYTQLYERNIQFIKQLAAGTDNHFNGN